jgi:hypothetical protein
MKEEMAAALMPSPNESDFVGMMGGEEFGVDLLNLADDGLDEAIRLAEAQALGAVTMDFSSAHTAPSTVGGACSRGGGGGGRGAGGDSGDDDDDCAASMLDLEDAELDDAVRLAEEQAAQMTFAPP